MQKSGILKVSLGLAAVIIAAMGIYIISFQNAKKEIAREMLTEQESNTKDQTVEHIKSKAEKAKLKAQKLEAHKKHIRNNILKYVEQKATYNVEGFGGIKNVLVSFYNNTRYPIEEAIVRVTYIKANGTVWTTMDVILRNIASQGFAIERSQDTNRGVKVRTEILSIHSRALHLCYNGISAGSDPYNCNN